MPNPLATALDLQERRRSGRHPGATSYAGATANRLTADWVLATIRSADAEIKGDLQRLKARSRELVRNDEHATRFQGLLDENVIGPQGIRLQSKAGGDEEKEIESGWREWGLPDTCTADGRMSLRDIAALSLQTMAADGEYLVRMLPGFPNGWGFALQMLDTDQLDHTYNVAQGRNQNEIRMGVELNDDKRPVAYHIWTEHPYDLTSGRDRRRIRVPANQILHDFAPLRAAQTRGVPWYAPVMMNTRMLGGYREAELVASRAAAAKMGFFTRDADAEPDPDAWEAEASGGNETLTMEAEPGLAEELPAGVKFQAWDPEHPTTAFESFVRSILGSIATGLRVSYNKLAGDYEKVSYSSLREANLAERDVWKILQVRMIQHFLTPIYREWTKWAITTGRLDLQSFDPRVYHDVNWQPRGWTWVDPFDDIQAAEKEIELGVNSRTRIAAEQGRDIAEVMDELEREKEMARERGLMLGGVPKAMTPSRARRDRQARHNGNGRPPADRLEPLRNGRT